MDASYLSQQVNGIIDQLHGLFDEIGISPHEQEVREEELFNALSETLNNQVRQVTNEKKNMIDESQRTINAIRQMEASIDDPRSRRDYDANEELQITYPLNRCLQGLKEKHLQISKIHRERFEQVRKLVEALESYSSHLEDSFVRIPLPPTGPNQSIPLNFDLSPSYVDKLDAEFTRVYEEYTRRVATVKTLGEEIIQLWAELGTPQAQTDSAIVKHYRDTPEQLGLHEGDLDRLRNRREKLLDEKKAREKRLKDLKAAVDNLWGKLGIEEPEKKAFLNRNRGCGIRQINEFEDELARLNEMKRQNLPTFVEDARCRLQELWDVLYLSEDEMLEFTPAFSDVYSDALLEAHEQEISRLEALREQRAPTLAMVDKHVSLVRERDDLAASSQDASRLMMRGQKGERRDPGKLLREEKMRKRIAKELPKVTAELKKALEAWEDEYGRPFLVHGERYLDTIYGESSRSSGSKPASSIPPMRPKTPAGPAPSATKTTAVPTKRGPTVSASATRNAPSRAGAKTPTVSIASATSASHVKRAQPTVSNIPSGRASPSRLPAPTSTTRPPLGTLKYGSNSPERPRAGTMAACNAQRYGPENASGLLRAAPALMRAPPPKMRELVRAPQLETPVNPYRGMNLESSAANVRQVDPEDVYEDHYEDEADEEPYDGRYDEPYDDKFQFDDRYDQRSQSSNTHSTRPPSSQSYSSKTSQQYRQQQMQQMHQQQQMHHLQQQKQYEKQYEKQYAGSVRQISNTSTAVSGSENWETYTDNSELEPEPDASEAYYAKMRAARGKRMSPDAPSERHYGQHASGRPQSSMSKRQRGLPPPSTPYAGAHGTVDAEGNRIISGSEWTDEDAF